MPHIAAIAKIDLPHKAEQQDVKAYAESLFSPSFPQVSRLLSSFDNTGIRYRNFCKPLDYYGNARTFAETNRDHIDTALHYSVQAVEDCLAKANMPKEAITDILFISSTGLATPSLDALLVNRMKLDPNISRTPIFGLGCAGGVSGIAKANTIARANPDAAVMVVAVELCSLTFLKQDFSKSNFIASGLFSDGIAACLVKGDNYHNPKPVSIAASGSRLYYDTLDIMGWEFLDSGFKVVFSKDIPTLINENVKADISTFLAKQGLTLNDIKNFIFHPGGTKVLSAYEDALELHTDDLAYTRDIITNYGNMSSVTVMYVLEAFMSRDYESGYGLMLAMGPGFSSEMVLLNMFKN